MFLFFPSVCATPLQRGCFTFLLLLVYSLLGWCGEMVYCSIGQRKLCEKRGFLNGPLCPIYGHGALVVLLALDGGCDNPLLTFLLGVVLTSLVEYATSYIMEKLFHMRWWDYSRYRFHINGRVCLLNSALFGLASVFLCHVANPPIAQRLGSLFLSGLGIPLALLLGGVYLADIVVSVRSAIRIGDHLAKLHAIHDELAGKLEALKAEQQQALELRRQHLGEKAAEAAQALQEKLEPLTERSEDFTARLEAARAEAQQKLRALCERQDFFDRRLLRSFPTLNSPHHPEALKKLREYLAERKQLIKETNKNKEM